MNKQGKESVMSKICKVKYEYRTITAKMACLESLCKTFEAHVKLLNFTKLQILEYQPNKKFYVKLLPLVENFICSNFAPV